MKLILTRHGKTDENIAGIIMGQLPGKLSEAAISGTEELRDKIKNIKLDVIYSSDLKRCVDTATILKGNSNVRIILEPGLRETHFGKYQGKPYSLVKGDYVSNLQKKFPGGESNTDLIRRVIDTINNIYQHNKNKTVLIVTHSGPISVINAALFNRTFAEEIQNKATHNDIQVIHIRKNLVYPNT